MITRRWKLAAAYACALALGGMSSAYAQSGGPAAAVRATARPVTDRPAATYSMVALASAPVRMSAAAMTETVGGSWWTSIVLGMGGAGGDGVASVLGDVIAAACVTGIIC